MIRVATTWLSLLTSTIAAPAFGVSFDWDTDADGDWNTAANWDPAQVPGSGDDAVIDRPGETGAPPTVTHSAGATSIQSLLNNESLVVNAGSSLATSDFSGAAGASLRAVNGGSFTAARSVAIDGMALGAESGGQIDLGTLPSYSLAGNRTDWDALGAGSRIGASGATSLSGGTSPGQVWSVDATNGGVIDLSGATSLSDSNTRFFADGASSLIDLSSLGTFSDTSPSDGSSIFARGGGEVRLRSDAGANLSIDGYFVWRHGASSILDTSRVTHLSNSAVRVDGAGTTLDLSNLASFDTNTFTALDGAALTLSTTSYSAAGGNTSRSFRAQGMSGGPSRIDASAVTTLTGGTTFGHSLEVQAREGGVVDLGAVTTLSDSNVGFEAGDAGSLVDISSIETFSDTVSSLVSSIEAHVGGEVRLRTDAGANLRIEGYHLLRNGATAVLDTSRVTELSNSLVEVRGSGTTLDLSNVASFDTNAFEAIDGAALTLHTASYSAVAGGINFSRSLRAAGAGAQIDGSALSELTGGTTRSSLGVSAEHGGHVDLGHVTTLTDSSIRFAARGAGSLLDLSSLESYVDTSQSRVSSILAADGGEVRLRSDSGATLSIDGYQISKSGAASALDTSRLTGLVNSTVTVRGSRTTFDLSNLREIDANSFAAFDGGSLTLLAASYSAAGGDESSRRMSAEGNSGGPSRIDASTLTSLTGGLTASTDLMLDASDGGEIDLSGLTALVDSNASFRAQDRGSLVDLSALSGFADTIEGSESFIEALDGGEVRLNTDPGAEISIDSYRILKYGGTSVLDTSRVTNLTNSRVEVVGTGTLDLSNLTSYDTNSFHAGEGAEIVLHATSYSAAGSSDAPRWFIASGINGSRSRIDGGMLTSLQGGTSLQPGNQFGRFQLTALDGGLVDLSNVTTLTRQATIVADGTSSVVDLGALSTFDSRGSSTARIEATDGGIVQLIHTGSLALTGVDLFATQNGAIRGDLVELLGTSRVRGSGNLALNELVNAAFVEPGVLGQEIGQIAFGGTYTQTATGTFDIQIGGLAAGEFDSLEVAGNAILAGAIRVSFIGTDGGRPVSTFVPQLGDRFDVLSAASIVDNGIATTTGISPGLAWHTEIVASGGRDVLRLLVVIPEPSTFSLGVLGLALIAAARRRREGAHMWGRRCHD